MESMGAKRKNGWRTIVLLWAAGMGMHLLGSALSGRPGTVWKMLLPVNETVWEHMKLLWYPLLGAGVCDACRQREPGVLGGYVLAGGMGILLELGAFALYESIAGESLLWLDIGLYLTDVAVCVGLAELLNTEKGILSARRLWIALAALITAGIVFLTFSPGRGYVF